MPLLSVILHSGAADPGLLLWIKEFLDHLIGFGPWMVVLAIGVLLLAMPMGLVSLFVVQHRRGKAAFLCQIVPPKPATGHRFS